MNIKKIAVFTGTRAEYGLLYWLLKDIQSDPELSLQLIVSGMHFAPEFGETYKQIEKDGFHIDEKIEYYCHQIPQWVSQKVSGSAY